MLITTTAQLSEFCARQKGAEFITVDTEFMRERTYWPKLCLVQIGGADQSVAIDPLAPGIDLAPLFALMDDPKIVKVFHAARQDVEIFHHLSGHIPAPMFDTQVAAMVCGYGESVSYETLAGSLANAKIDKSSRFTDWAARPLSDRQITYALGDVIYLREVYVKLERKLEESGRAGWVSEEMGVLTNPATYAADPREAWRRLKVRSEKPKFCAILRELAAWREIEAQRIDVPRNRVLRDEALLEIAHHPPQSAVDLARIRGLSNGFADSRQGAEILKAVAAALALPPEQYPDSEQRRNIPNGIGAVVDLLKVLLRHVADEQGVATKLIANSDDLEDIAINDMADVAALQGWRRELFGNTALALKKGELVIGLKGRKIALTRVALS